MRTLKVLFEFFASCTFNTTQAHLSHHRLLVFLLFLSRRSIWKDWQKFFVYELSFITHDTIDQHQTCFLRHTDKCFQNVLLTVILGSCGQYSFNTGVKIKAHLHTFRNCLHEYKLTHFFPMFPFDPPENIRKPKIFCFQGGQKGTLRRKGFSNYASNLSLLCELYCRQKPFTTIDKSCNYFIGR